MDTAHSAAAVREGSGRLGRALFTFLPLAALAGGLLAFAAGTDWYSVFKLVHLVAAVIWVGGGCALTVSALRAERAGDDEGLVRIGKQVEWIGMRIFTPASFVVLAFGFAMAEKGDLDYGEFWLSFGLAAWLVSALTGM